MKYFPSLLAMAVFLSAACAPTQPALGQALQAAPPAAVTPTASRRPVAPPAVPRLGKFEASFTLPDQSGNPFDPQDNDVDVTFVGPAKKSVTVPAFWDGDRWRVRYAPTAVGAYALHVSRNGRGDAPADLTPSGFRCVASADPGFVRRDAKIVQRFVFDDGTPYYPLGMDVAWTAGNGPDYPDYFASMGRARMNWARVWMNAWDGKNLEWAPNSRDNPPIGTFLLSAARRWDGIFDAAARNGVYVQMTLQHHGQYTNVTDPNWRDNPFNAARGGFLKLPTDFFSDPTARRLTRAKYRYIVARWGYSTHLLAFELFNEVQDIREIDDHFGDVVQWHREMAAYVRSLDVNHHLVTTSNSPAYSPLAHIGLDYDQPHTYPPDVVARFADLDTAGVDVPLFYGEWGLPKKQTEQGLHDGLWAGLAAPTAGIQQYWFWDQVEANGWWPQFASATGFVDTLGVAKLGGMTRLQPVVSGPGQALSGPAPGLDALARGDARHAVFWAYTRDRSADAAPQDATLTLPGLAPGRYTVRLWDPWRGGPAGVLSVQAGRGGAVIALRGLSRDIAGVVTPAP